ncbi:MAG: hypothetical protein Q9160_005838 [Pyrenula sp. 1 TL-2023]
MDPTGPSQPPIQTSYNHPSNPLQQTPAERENATRQSPSNAPIIDRRPASDQSVPSTHANPPTSTSLGYGDTGPLKERSDIATDPETAAGRDPNLEGEQMRAAGEGDIAKAVTSEASHTFGEGQDVGGDLGRKAEEHKAMLHERGQKTPGEIEREEKEDWTGRKGEVDLEGALGGRGKGVVLQADDVR